METLKDVEMRLEFCNSSEPVIKYDQEKVRQRYLEQRKNLAILQYILGKTPTDYFQGKMDKNKFFLVRTQFRREIPCTDYLYST